MRPWPPEQRIGAVVFDCDGVILESVRSKGDAFRRLFAAWPAHQDAIEAFHYANGGMSRYAKFDHIFATILRQPLPPDERVALGQRYAALVVDEVVACPMVEGALSLLQSLHGRCPMFVASATPEPELIHILETRQLAGFFRGIAGHPTTKADAIRGAQAATGVPMDQILFIGDARADLDAAAAAGCRFIGRETAGRPPVFSGTGVPVVADCRPIEEWLRS